MKSLILLLGFLLLLSLVSCNDNDDTISSPIDLSIANYNNIPVKVNTENSFTFTVSANNLDYKIEEDLIFTGDSVVITITLSQASSDASAVYLFDNAGNIIFDESLNESKVIVDNNIIREIPKRIKIDLINFTGKLTIVVATD